MSIEQDEKSWVNISKEKWQQQQQQQQQQKTHSVNSYNCNQQTKYYVPVQ